MRYIFKFPDIGEGITEGKILKWYIKKGEMIESGAPVVNMETDKVVTDIPSPKTGRIAEVFGNEGDTINVDDPLIEIEISTSDSESPGAVETDENLKTEPVEEKGFGVVGTIEVAKSSAYLPVSNEGAEQEESSHSTVKKKVLATPVARAMAKEMGIDINRVRGTGPAGRVMKSDISNYRESDIVVEKVNSDNTGSTDSGEKIIELSQIRKTIARNMTISKQKAPHMTLFEETEVTGLVEFRKEYKERMLQRDVKLTYLPFIIKAVSTSLAKHPLLNSRIELDNNRIILSNEINIGIAIDTEEGLIVPVIRNCNSKSIIELAKKIEDYSKLALERKLTLEDMKGGTFTITNFGSIGGTHGVPIINYPQAAILGIGRIVKKPVVKENEIVIGNILPLSMSVDHRIVDGGEASRFMKETSEMLENPLSLLLE